MGYASSGWLSYRINRGNNKSIILPIILIVGIFLIIYWVLFISLDETLELSKQAKVKDWGDIRSASLTLVTLLTPILVAIGYFLAIRRAQTSFKQNELNETKLEHSQLSQGLELLASQQTFKKLAGVALIGRMGVLSYQSGPGTNYAVLDQVAQDGSIDDLVRSAALRTLFELVETVTQLRGRSYRARFNDPTFDVKNLHLNGHLTRVVFVNGTKLPKRFSSITLNHVVFNRCSFHHTIFSEVKFNRVKFIFCHLDDVFFEHCEFIDCEGWEGTSFAKCTYQITSPPIGLQSQIKLGPPLKWINDQIQKQTREQSETFWSSDGNDKYRPRDRDGNLIEIVYPDEN